MIKENLLHHIWQFKKFDLFNSYTTSGKKIEIIRSGYYNTDSGPDFSFAKIKIDDIEWIGDVEIHVKSSDWIKHKHTLNPSYDSIILHVVYEMDVQIPSLQEKNIPTLELKSYISKSFLENYNHLENKSFTFIPCENLFDRYLHNPSISLSEKLYLGKLQEKCDHIFHILNLKNNDWEATLATTLAYAFGLKINAEAFEQIFLSLNYKIIRKISSRPTQLEALFLGLTNSFNKGDDDEYSELLKNEFNYLKRKFRFPKQTVEIKYLRLRPAHFPTIRLSQLANLFSKYQNLFSYVIGAKSLKQYDMILNEVKAFSYWDTHYILGKKSSKIPAKRTLSKAQKELIILNAFLPVKFAYSQSIGKPMGNEILTIIGEISAENNSIIKNFKKLGVNFKTALDSQAFLYLYKTKCSNKQCLNCEIGFEILK
ncbi:MAG: DUF2851 family protein [Flavobacteriaceae bacterium]|jgi:hypothetical protein|nr:DUF2851 family protein [Flavobacteriaceae bacterium]